jgi:hypothetical protein
VRLPRRVRRALLIKRAARVAREREFQELEAYLADLRARTLEIPPWQRRKYADD